MRRFGPAMVVVVLVALLPLSAGAQDPNAPPPPPTFTPYAPPPPVAATPEACPGVPYEDAWRCNPPRHFALTVALLKEYGFGGGLRGRFNHVGFEAAGAYMPYLVMGAEFHYFTTWQATGAFLVFFNADHRRTHHGLKVGYAYNSVSQNGLLLGYTLEFSRWKHFTVSLGFGFQYFFKAAELIEEKLRDEGENVEVSPVAGFQPYFGVGLHFYLL
jgi:hypothetical protein